MALKLAADGAVIIIAQIINPLPIPGFVIYILAALCYIVALKKIAVSIAFPWVPASYALVTVLAHLLWNEPRGLRIAGLALIGSSGVALIHQH
jgi:drug/metabolite transporter (DMT)-like permease